MPEKTKCDVSKKQNPAEKTSPEKSETDVEGNWSEDQKNKSYYYDDSYGYEIYDPENEKEDEDQ